MLHEDIMRSISAGERREEARAPCPGEVVMFWLHDPEMRIRFKLVDVSDGGFRIRSVAPVLKGTTGVVSRLLPEGTPIDRMVSVAWTQQGEDGTWDIGLRVIGS